MEQLDEQQVLIANIIDPLVNEVLMIKDVGFPASPGVFAELSIKVGQGWCAFACYVPDSTDSFPRGDILLSQRAFSYISNASRLSVPGSDNVADPGEIPFNTCSPVVEKLYSTMVHEAGHALGIGYSKAGLFHSRIQDSVMSSTRDRELSCTPLPFDIMAIYALYQVDD